MPHRVADPAPYHDGMARPTIADTAVELLADAPALTTDEILAVVVERGQTRARDPRTAVHAALDVNIRLVRLHDGRWVAPLHLLDGAVLTHELTQAEAAAGALEMGADIAPLWRLVLAKIPLHAGGRIQPAILDAVTRSLGPEVDRAIVGPPGWLPSMPGVFLHLRGAGGTLAVAEGARPRSTTRMAERRLVIRTQQGLDEDAPRFERDQGIADIAHVVLQALVEVPGLLDEPVAPLGDLLRGAGLEVHETQVGLPGTDWTGRSWSGRDASLDEEDDDEYDLDSELEELRESYELTDLQVGTMRVLLVALSLEEARTPIDDDETLARLAQLLEQPLIAELIADRAWFDAGVRTLAERILSAADPDARTGARYVLGVAAEAGEQPEAAQALLQASLADDPGFAPSLIALARIIVDRGRYAEALALLRRAEVPADDVERSFLEWVLRPTGGRVGRNDACPCGSGRKAKLCHPDGLGTVTLSPGERLIRKVQTWADRPENDERIHDLLSLMGIEEPPDDEDGDAEDPAWWLAHTLAADILVFDRDELDRFLRVRGPLLPAEELALAETWRSTQRSLLEVRAIDPGMGVTVLDLVDGSVRHVSDERMSRELERMDLVCARLLPDGVGGLISDDAFLVPPDGRARALQLVKGGDGLALLAWLISPVGRDIVH